MYSVYVGVAQYKVIHVLCDLLSSLWFYVWLLWLWIIQADRVCLLQVQSKQK